MADYYSRLVDLPRKVSVLATWMPFRTWRKGGFDGSYWFGGDFERGFVYVRVAGCELSIYRRSA